jgi:hypothetical protein
LGNSLIQDDGASTGVNSSPSASGMVSINRGALTESIILTSSDANNRIRFQNTTNTQIGIIQFSGDGFGVGCGGGYLSAITVGRTTNHVGIFGSPDASFRLSVGGTFRSSGDANINGLTVGKGGGSIASNTAFGVSAISSGSATGTSNTAVGQVALRDISTGNGNTAVGANAGPGISTGLRNTAIGSQTLEYLVSGNDNVAVGRAALNLTTGSNNIGIGSATALDLTTGSRNTIIGPAGTGITTGSFNTIIGQQITGLSSSLSNTIILADGQGNQRLYINSNGNAGIGTQTPFNSSAFGSLSLNGSSGGVLDLMRGGTSQFQIQATSSTNALAGQTNLPMSFQTNNAERMRIFSGGNISIGYGGSPTDAGYKLDVNGTARVSGTAVFQTANNTSSIQDLVSGTTYAALYLDQATPSLTNYALASNGSLVLLNAPSGNNIEFRTNNTTRWILTSTGSLINDANGNFSSVPFWVSTSSTTNYGIIVNGATSQTQDLFQLRNNVSTILSGFTANGNLFIGSTSLNASAALEVTSTTRGFLPPRGTNAQMLAIVSPVAGLIFYDTTNNKLNVYDGTNWVATH